MQRIVKIIFTFINILQPKLQHIFTEIIMWKAE